MMNRRATNPCRRHRVTVRVDTLKRRLTALTVRTGSAACSAFCPTVADRSSTNMRRSCRISPPSSTRSGAPSGRNPVIRIAEILIRIPPPGIDLPEELSRPGRSARAAAPAGRTAPAAPSVASAPGDDNGSPSPPLPRGHAMPLRSRHPSPESFDKASSPATIGPIVARTANLHQISHEIRLASVVPSEHFRLLFLEARSTKKVHCLRILRKQLPFGSKDSNDSVTLAVWTSLGIETLVLNRRFNLTFYSELSVARFFPTANSQIRQYCLPVDTVGKLCRLPARWTPGMRSRTTVSGSNQDADSRVLVSANPACTDRSPGG